MASISKYREPRNAAELAHAIEVWMLDAFGASCSGGCNKRGGDMDFQLDRESVNVTVMETGLASDLRRLKQGVWAGQVLEWLDADEMKIVEAHREVVRFQAEEARVAREKYSAAEPVAKPKRKGAGR